MYTPCLKKTQHKDMFDFFNPKNVTSGSGVDQTWKTPSFSPIGQKPPILHGILFLSLNSNVK